MLATDSKGTEAPPLGFDVRTRYENLKPSIGVLEDGILAVGSNIYEADSAGKVLFPLIEYTDDEPAPTAVFDGEPTFKTIVDPYLKEGEICSKGSKGCVHETGKVAIVVGDEDLNFEEQSLHRLSLALRDSWETDLVSEAIEFHVAVNDSNDTPTVVPETSIQAQSVVVNGSMTYLAGHLFFDEDGDRLLITANSSATNVVEVEVRDLDHVILFGRSEGRANVTLTATDPEGASTSTEFMVTVGPNNPPVADAESFASRVPADNTINVGGFHDFELDGLFSDPDSGDEITSITASSSDSNVPSRGV